MDLIENPHIGLPKPVQNVKAALVRGNYKYYHYKCDGFNDVGWGCGYRTLQTICTWIKNQLNDENVGELGHYSEVPSIPDFQKVLVEIGDKTSSFIGSHEWIGSVEVAYCIEKYYEVLCRIIHTRSIDDLENHTDDIEKHFLDYGSPIMMGGDRDCSSKCVLGISQTTSGAYLLILDPHFSGRNTSREVLQANNWVKWEKIKLLNRSSFYNLCCPLLKAKTEK